VISQTTRRLEDRDEVSVYMGTGILPSRKRKGPEARKCMAQRGKTGMVESEGARVRERA
jgi:hypothetical protein